MRIQIVEQFHGGHLSYAFESVVGRFCGTWKSRSIQPQIHHSYDVELDFVSPIILDENSAFTEKTAPHITVRNEKTVILGTIESVDTGGILFLRLHPSFLLMMESEFSNEAHVGKSIEITCNVDSVIVTPIGLGIPPN